MTRRCAHDIVLLGNRNLSSGKGVCPKCLTMVPVNVREPQWVAVFAVVRRLSDRERIRAQVALGGGRL